MLSIMEQAKCSSAGHNLCTMDVGAWLQATLHHPAAVRLPSQRGCCLDSPKVCRFSSYGLASRDCICCTGAADDIVLDGP